MPDDNAWCSDCWMMPARAERRVPPFPSFPNCSRCSASIVPFLDLVPNLSKYRSAQKRHFSSQRHQRLMLLQYICYADCSLVSLFVYLGPVWLFYIIYMIHIWITKHSKPLPEIKSKVWGFGIPKVTKMKSHELRFGILLTRPRMPKIKSKVWQTSIDIS